MSSTKLATRYAKSVLDFAKEKGKLSEVLADMRLLNKKKWNYGEEQKNK